METRLDPTMIGPFTNRTNAMAGVKNNDVKHDEKAAIEGNEENVNVSADKVLKNDVSSLAPVKNEESPASTNEPTAPPKEITACKEQEGGISSVSYPVEEVVGISANSQSTMINTIKNADSSSNNCEAATTVTESSEDTKLGTSIIEAVTLTAVKEDSSCEDTKLCAVTSDEVNTLTIKVDEDTTLCSANSEAETPAIKKMDSFDSSMQLCPTSSDEAISLAIKMGEDTKLCSANSETETPTIKAVNSSDTDPKLCSATSGEANSLEIKVGEDTQLCSADNKTEMSAIKAVDSSCADTELSCSKSGEVNSPATKTDEDTKRGSANSEAEMYAIKAVNASGGTLKVPSETSDEANSAAGKVGEGTEPCTGKNCEKTPPPMKKDSSCDDAKLPCSTNIETSTPTTKMDPPSEESKLCTGKMATESPKEVDEAVADTSMSMTHPPEILSNEQAAVSSDTQVKTEGPADGDDDDMEEEDLEPATRLDLLESLGDFESPGSTCTGGFASTLPAVPGLHVKGVGYISLPLVDSQAAALAQIAAQAPHGQGTKTVIDTSVRKTWQIEPAAVTLENPEWPTALEQLKVKVSTDLGVAPAQVTLEMYKLLLYEPGGFFKKHRDTEKAEGMFGTLVVQLPSRYSGGSFVVSHDGDTKEFDLGSGGKSAYGCHFVAHYADCEHEIKEVESGYRMALVYSLCFNGGRYKPTAAAISGAQSDLKRVLNRLPFEDRICMFPLDHQYTIASLSRLGLNALKARDRDFQRAIEAASDGTWKFVIVQASRTDHESGDGERGGYYGYSDFNVYDTEEGSPSLAGSIFSADGSDCSNDLGWMERATNFNPVDDDDNGMLLVRSDDIEDMWGEGDEGSVEYTGNEGASRETTYSTYVIVAYDINLELNLMCRHDLSNCIKKVADGSNPSSTTKLLNCIVRSNSAVSSSNFLQLLNVVKPPTTSPSREDIKRLADLFSSWSMEESVILPPEVFAILDWFGKVLDCAEAMMILETFFSRPSSGPGVFLAKAEMGAYLASTKPCEMFSKLIPMLARNFRPKAVSSSGYSYMARSSSSCTNVHSHKGKITTLLEKNAWVVVKDAVIACLQTMVAKEMGTSRARFHCTLDLLAIATKNAPADAELQIVCRMVVIACVSDTDSKSTPGHCSLAENDHTSGKACEFLLKYGDADLFSRLENWAPTCNSSERLGWLEKHMRQAAETIENPPAPTANLLAALKEASVRRRILHLESRREQLRVSTLSSPPPFSWRMSGARHHNKQIEAFLRGPEQSKTLIVGGGVTTSRRLSTRGRHSSDTFSATIQATSSTGRNASVTVTKTRDAHNNLVNKYTASQKEIRDINVEIAHLGGTSAAAPEVVDISDSERPAKKQKVRMPIPIGAEVISID